MLSQLLIINFFLNKNEVKLTPYKKKQTLTFLGISWLLLAQKFAHGHLQDKGKTTLQ